MNYNNMNPHVAGQQQGMYQQGAQPQMSPQQLAQYQAMLQQQQMQQQPMQQQGMYQQPTQQPMQQQGMYQQPTLTAYQQAMLAKQQQRQGMQQQGMYQQQPMYNQGMYQQQRQSNMYPNAGFQQVQQQPNKTSNSFSNVGSKYESMEPSNDYLEPATNNDEMVNENLNVDTILNPEYGHEYKPLVSSSATYEMIETKPGIYEYIIKVSKMDKPIKNVLSLVDEEDTAICYDVTEGNKLLNLSDTAITLKLHAIDNDAEAVYINALHKIPAITSINVKDENIYDNLIKLGSLGAIANRLKSLLDPNSDVEELTKNYYSRIDKYLANRVTNILNYVINTSIVISSIAEDLNDLPSYIEENYGVTKRNDYIKAVNELHETLEYDIEGTDELKKDITSGEKGKIVNIPEKIVICYTNNKTILDSIDTMEDTTLSVTDISHYPLASLITNLNENSWFKDNVILYIVTDQHTLKVFKSIDNKYIITKDI